MKPPKCKVCGNEHYGPCFVRPDRIIIADPGHQPGKKPPKSIERRFEQDVAPILVRSRLAADAPEGAVRATMPPKNATRVSVSAPAKRGRPISDKPKSPRAEYQRELMRKRRSK